jgi:hypothetical protein
MFALAVVSLCVVVLGVAFIQITWRNSRASLQLQRRRRAGHPRPRVVDDGTVKG